MISSVIIIFQANIVFVNMVVSVLQFGAYFLDYSESNDRLGVVLNVVLASSALRYVYQEKLPSAPSSTVLDMYLNISMIHALFMAGLCFMCERSHRPQYNERS